MANLTDATGMSSAEIELYLKRHEPYLKKYERKKANKEKQREAFIAFLKAYKSLIDLETDVWYNPPYENSVHLTDIKGFHADCYDYWYETNPEIE